MENVIYFIFRQKAQKNSIYLSFATWQMSLMSLLINLMCSWRIKVVIYLKKTTKHLNCSRSVIIYSLESYWILFLVFVRSSTSSSMTPSWRRVSAATPPSQPISFALFTTTWTDWILRPTPVQSKRSSGWEAFRAEDMKRFLCFCFDLIYKVLKKRWNMSVVCWISAVWCETEPCRLSGRF